MISKAVYKHGYLIITAAWLYTLSFIFINYWRFDSSPNKAQSKLEQHLIKNEEAFNRIVADTNLLSSLLKDSANEISGNRISDMPFGFFLYSFNDVHNPILVFWNSNKYYFDKEDELKADGNYFVNYQNGDFELIKRTVHQGTLNVMAIGILPIRWNYFIENKYLRTNFDGFKGLEDKYEITKDSLALPIKNSLGKILFSIKLKEEDALVEYDFVTVLLRILAVLLLLFFLNDVSKEISYQNFKKGFSFLLSSVILLRFITYLFPIPFDFNKLPLFDPSVYASNFLHRSLGDLLINTSLFFWIISFYKSYQKLNNVLFERVGKLKPYLNLVILVLLILVVASIERSLVLDSKISFDVANFLNLNIYTAISFFILCLLVLSFFNLSHLLMFAVFARKVSLSVQLLVISITGLIYLSLTINQPQTISNLIIIIWLLLYIVIINFRKGDIQLPLLKSSFFIFWVMFFALSASLLILYENKLIELEQRKRVADKLAQQTDPSGENLLKIATSNFNDAFLSANYVRFYSENQNKFIKDSLINENFSGYLNKFDTRIYTFDSLFHPLFNDDSTGYASIKTIILNQAKQIADFKGLYSFENSAGQISYLFEKPLRDSVSADGYLFVIVKPKNYASEALYPELFKQTQDLSADLNTDYAYAIYNNAKLISHFNEYDFPSQLVKNKSAVSEFQLTDNNEFNELWYNAGNGKQIVIAKRNSFWLEFVTLFAYLFCSFLLAISLFYVGNYFLENRFKLESVKQFFRINIRSQIHATIIFISVFSFVVIAIAIISFFINRFNKSNEERLSKSIQVMATEIQRKVKSQMIFDDAITINDLGFGSNIERMINEISEVHNADVNYYDALGNLKVSTQPYIYNKHLLNGKMEPSAYYQLHHNKLMRYVQQERIGNLSYLSIYVPVVDENGNVYAYLNIPFLNSQAELNQEISSFLATLINLNAFIFLIAGAIAFLITNRITSLFSLIGKKMQEVSLGKVNEEIKWSRDDEIGILIGEYNKMVNKLEASAKALAQSEREGAWREMARQVAHEIKNPLTPMKLSIQYLLKSIDSGALNVKELSKQVATTLVEQIDQLSKIAGDFSQFANIGNVRLEKINVNEVIESLINLYKYDTTIQIEWIKENSEYFIEADKVQINRLLTNLLKNAVEASAERKIKIIRIHQFIKNNTIQLEVSDNGTGIPKKIQHKIFTPNFTTKTSGTGLGLAICKGIVEKAKGNIWFKTEEGEGSTFIVELPLSK